MTLPEQQDPQLFTEPGPGDAVENEVDCVVEVHGEVHDGEHEVLQFDVLVGGGGGSPVGLNDEEDAGEGTLKSEYDREERERERERGSERDKERER